MTDTLERPLMGVRDFAVHMDGYLRSPVADDVVWTPDTVQGATCHTNAQRVALEHEKHAAPESDCRCGCYAYYSTQEQDRHGGVSPAVQPVGAVVSAWGDVVLHDVGFRAEYMQVEAIVMLGDVEEYHLATGSDLTPAELVQSWHQLAERYAVPLLAPSEADAFCRENGEVLEATPYVDQAEAFVQIQAQISKSLKQMAEELKPVIDRINAKYGHEAQTRPARNFAEAIEKKRNKPAFWRDFAGGDVHDGR